MKPMAGASLPPPFISENLIDNLFADPEPGPHFQGPAKA